MEEFAHIAEHVMEHSVADTLYLIPFLFVTYLAMEWLEHKTGGKTQEAIRHAGAAGPIVGAFLGVVPQCGFSAVAATLYAGRVITLGTLFRDAVSLVHHEGSHRMVMGFIVDACCREHKSACASMAVRRPYATPVRPGPSTAISGRGARVRLLGRGGDYWSTPRVITLGTHVLEGHLPGKRCPRHHRVHGGRRWSSHVHLYRGRRAAPAAPRQGAPAHP